MPRKQTVIPAKPLIVDLGQELRDWVVDLVNERRKNGELGCSQVQVVREAVGYYQRHAQKAMREMKRVALAANGSSEPSNAKTSKSPAQQTSTK